jgi:nucleotide-binding universal stress UspA family protein
MYRRILVPIDGSATAARGLDEAIGLAKLTGASLCLVHVVELINFATCLEASAVYANDAIAAMTRAGKEVLDRAMIHVAASGVSAETLLLDNLANRVSELVIEHAKAWDADLIVIGTHGRRGVGRFLIGSDAEEIARMAPVPVLLVRAPAAGGDKAHSVPARDSIPA